MSDPIMPPANVIEEAERVAAASPCAKSKRGAVLYRPYPKIGEILPSFGSIASSGYNRPPPPRSCDGSEACRATCGKRCVHAESMAIREFDPGDRVFDQYLGKSGEIDLSAYDLVHVKIDDGDVVPSGGPSCWQCSREILDTGIGGMWLLRDDGWHRYTALEFHRLTEDECGIYRGPT